MEINKLQKQLDVVSKQIIKSEERLKELQKKKKAIENTIKEENMQIVFSAGSKNNFTTSDWNKLSALISSGDIRALIGDDEEVLQEEKEILREVEHTTEYDYATSIEEDKS